MRPGRIKMENGANGIKCDWRSWEIKMLMEKLCTMKKGHKVKEFLFSHGILLIAFKLIQICAFYFADIKI